MIDWNNYFDHIYCLFYTKQKDRKNDIDAELERVGILDSGIFSYYYNTDNPFYNNIMCTINKDKKYPELNFIRCFNPFYGHYLMLKEASELEYNRVLFLESDAKFMKDQDKIVSILHNIPSDFDMILFDRSIRYEYQDRQLKVNDFFRKYDSTNGSYGLFTSVAMSKRMIRWMVDRQEKVFGCTDDIWNCNDNLLNTYNKYLSIDHMVIQREYNNRASTIKSFMETIYKRDGANLDDFDV